MQNLEKIINDVVLHFSSVTVWLILASWTSAFLGAIIYYVWQYKAESKSFKGFFIFTFPKRLIVHRSTRLDVIFTVVNKVTEPLTVAPFLIATTTISTAVYFGLNTSFGSVQQNESIVWLSAIMLVVILIVQDFSVFMTHYIEHKVPILWEIHKVHHSLPVMTPLSNRRHHPWQLLFEAGIANMLVGIVLGSVSYLAGVPLLDTILLGTDAYFVANTLSFYQLRHSHIPLSYGRFERWFMSPAQHQLHHSVEVNDWDRNFSLLLSCWDRIAGTINYSNHNYTYRIGLQPQYDKDYDNVWKFFYVPIRNIIRIIAKKTRSETIVVQQSPDHVPSQSTLKLPSIAKY